MKMRVLFVMVTEGRDQFTSILITKRDFAIDLDWFGRSACVNFANNGNVRCL